MCFWVLNTENLINWDHIVPHHNLLSKCTVCVAFKFFILVQIFQLKIVPFLVLQIQVSSPTRTWLDPSLQLHVPLVDVDKVCWSLMLESCFNETLFFSFSLNKKKYNQYMRQI